MRRLDHRVRRLESQQGSDTCDPRSQLAVEEIRASRRRRLGGDYREPEPFPEECFAACHSIADYMRRERQLLREREAGVAAGLDSSR